MAAKLECPHCHQLTISPWRKGLLGPALSVTCSACGGKATVRNNFGGVLAGGVAILAQIVTHSILLSFVALIVALIPVVWFQVKAMPLVPAAKPDK
jgi:hypothetical protein